MKAQLVGGVRDEGAQVLLTFDNDTEVDAIKVARCAVRKASLATDLDSDASARDVRSVNAVLMLTGRVLDAERNSSVESLSI